MTEVPKTLGRCTIKMLIHSMFPFTTFVLVCKGTRCQLNHNFHPNYPTMSVQCLGVGNTGEDPHEAYRSVGSTTGVVFTYPTTRISQSVSRIGSCGLNDGIRRAGITIYRVPLQFKQFKQF